MAWPAEINSNELEKIWGKIYVQGGTEGLASYHFGRCENYISYSNALCSCWRDDAGNKFPLTKPFEQIKVDSVKRIFEAVVSWTPTSVSGGTAQWKYKMKFNTDYKEIIDGTCSSVDAHEVTTQEVKFGVDLKYKILYKLTFC